MVTFHSKGNFTRTERFFEHARQVLKLGILDKYGRKGVEILRENTPRETGKTADSWGYYIEHKNGGDSIVWTNSNINDGAPIAILLQYGHATGTGGFVQGVDYINPAIKPLFEQLADEAWKEVIRI